MTLRRASTRRCGIYCLHLQRQAVQEDTVILRKVGNYAPKTGVFSSRHFLIFIIVATFRDHSELPRYFSVVSFRSVSARYSRRHPFPITPFVRHWTYHDDYCDGFCVRGGTPVSPCCTASSQKSVVFCEVQMSTYRVSQEEWTKLRESVPYVELYRYNPKHLYPRLNGYGDNGQRSLKRWQLLHTYWLPNTY